MLPHEGIHPIDARDYVMREQGRFFRGGRYNPFETASMIALEAMLSGATDVRVIVVDGWVCIAADIDWLAGREDEVFEGLMPFPSGGPNGVTSEFLPMVFSRSVATAGHGSIRSVKGDSLGPLDGLLGNWLRAVAFAV